MGLQRSSVASRPLDVTPIGSSAAQGILIPQCFVPMDSNPPVEIKEDKTTSAHQIKCNEHSNDVYCKPVLLTVSCLLLCSIGSLVSASTGSFLDDKRSRMQSNASEHHW